MGNSLNINCSTYVVQEQILAGVPLNVNVNRSISRLKTIFLTFFKAEQANAIYYTETNLYYHPMYGQDLYLHDRELELQVQIGSKLFPEYPMKSIAEAFSQLRKCLGIASSPIHSFHMRPDDYRTKNFIVGLDRERVLQAGYALQNG